MRFMADSNPLAHSPTLTATTPGEDSARFAAGATVGEYVIDRFIGAGAMGEVYAGKHPVIGKRVAIKVLRHELAASAEAAERFIREARAANQIDHENVIDVFAFGRLDDGRLYLVMDLVEGKSLRAALVDGPLDLDRALAILDTIAGALDAAHKKGVVHRDLKPDNIVLTNATPPKVFVLDFGIAKLISTANAGDAGPGTLTGKGTWLGTPGYMAPEQWSADGAGPASDRYALGVIAFELLSGALPFSAPSVPGMMEQHFRAKVPALSARGAVGVPAQIDAVIERALAKEPEKRFATAREFVEALRAAAGTGVHRARGAVAAPVSARTLWVPAIAGTALLGGAVVVVLMSREREAKPAPAVAPPAAPEPAQPASDVEIVSVPPGAAVLRAGTVVGKTPTRVRSKPGETLDVLISKPGYLPEPRALEVQPTDNKLAVNLVQVSGFQGVWKLGNGELRSFRRNGDRVDVYKLVEVNGHATFFKTYEFVHAERGVAFADDDEIVDARAPNDPRCHIKVHVEYRYNPTGDELEQLRDKVKIGFKDGSCTVDSVKATPTKLARAEVVDALEIDAPAGTPNKKPPAKKGGKKIPLDPKADLFQQKQLDAEAAKKAEAQRNVAPKNAKSPPSFEDEVQANQAQQAVKPAKPQPPPAQNAQRIDPQSQILPEPKAPAPSVNAEDTQQRQKK
jgi:tRNA A-37 threonylcarbamoyl transferase component Bud32